MNKCIKPITFKVSEREKEVLEQKYKKTNLSRSEFIRQSIFFSEVKEIDKESQKRKLFLLNNIANNINQIAKYCNTKKAIHISTLTSLDETLKYVKAICKEE